MLKVLAILFGLIFIITGILGFLPQYSPDEYLFGIFAVNLPHNLANLATGVIAILCGFSSSRASKLFFIIFGLIFAVFAGLGFYYGEDKLFGLIAINQAGNWLNAAVAAIALYLGLTLHSK